MQLYARVIRPAQIFQTICASGDVDFLYNACRYLHAMLDLSTSFSQALQAQLQASPAQQRQLAEALDHCALTAATAAFHQPQPGSSRGSAASRRGSAGSSSPGTGMVAASAAAAGRAGPCEAAPEQAVIAALHARWSPALVRPPAAPGASPAKPLTANARELLDLASQLLAAAPARLPPAGPQRSTYIRAALPVCCFVGQAGARYCARMPVVSEAGTPELEGIAVAQPATHAALRLLPRLAAAWQQLLGGASSSELSAGMQAINQDMHAAQLAASSGSIQPALYSLAVCCLLGARLTGLSTAGQLSDWCVATNAALRLVPALLPLPASDVAAFAPLPAIPFVVIHLTSHFAAAAMGERSLHLGCGGCSGCAAPAQSTPLRLTAAQARSLQVLHSTACRAVHMLLGTQSDILAALSTVPGMACHPHTAVATAFNVLLAARSAAEGQGQPEGQEPALSRWVRMQGQHSTVLCVMLRLPFHWLSHLSFPLRAEHYSCPMLNAGMRCSLWR